MKDEMKRGRSQVIWRYTPGAMFRYNESGGWWRTTDVTLRDTTPLGGALGEAVAQALHRWKAVGPAGYPDPTSQPTKYAVGVPYQVLYDVWPTVFTCRQCGRVHFYRDLARLRQVNERLRCMTCKGNDLLRQVPYAYVCECGRLDSISMQKHDATHPIQLIDKGSFQESYWRCKLCGIPLYRNPREGLGFRRCECVPRKGKRGILLQDSRVYYSQTIDLVEIEPAVVERWKDHNRFSDLLLAAALRVPAYEPGHLLDLAAWKQTGTDLSPELKAMRAVLIRDGKSEAEAERMVREGAKQAGTDPWVSYDADLAPYRSMAGGHNWKDSRRTIEYIFVRDEPSAAAISLDQLIRAAKDQGDQVVAQRLERERELASQLGLVDLRIVQALPILLAGIGFTRYFASPRDAEEAADAANVRPVALRPYESKDGKIPIYVARNPTEALLYEIDPWRMAAFLQINADASIPKEATASTPALRAWCLGQCGRLIETGESHLVLRSHEIEAGVTVDDKSALVFGVLHTMSHVLKATAQRYVGIDSDALAEYLFPAHGAGLLYVSSHVQFTLGGMDSVFRANLTQWLGSARDFAGRCSFDPVCSSIGGACLACLYPKFGCAYFNRTVSRSFLFGGKLPGRNKHLEGFWAPRIADASERLRLRSGGSA